MGRGKARAGPCRTTPGSVGDASVLTLEEGAFDFADSTGARMAGSRRLSAAATIVNGKLWNVNGEVQDDA